jgi:hypothetical protein
MHFSCQEIKKNTNNQLLVRSNPTIIHLHTLYHMKEDMTAYLMR